MLDSDDLLGKDYLQRAADFIVVSLAQHAAGVAQRYNWVWNRSAGILNGVPTRNVPGLSKHNMPAVGRTRPSSRSAVRRGAHAAEDHNPPFFTLSRGVRC